MRGLSLIGGLLLSHLPVLVAHANEVELADCQCLCALNCRGRVCGTGGTSEAARANAAAALEDVRRAWVAGKQPGGQP